MNQVNGKCQSTPNVKLKAMVAAGKFLMKGNVCNLDHHQKKIFGGKHIINRHSARMMDLAISERFHLTWYLQWKSILIYEPSDNSIRPVLWFDLMKSTG